MYFFQVMWTKICLTWTFMFFNFINILSIKQFEFSSNIILSNKSSYNNFYVFWFIHIVNLWSSLNVSGITDLKNMAIYTTSIMPGIRLVCRVFIYVHGVIIGDFDSITANCNDIHTWQRSIINQPARRNNKHWRIRTHI